MSNRLIIPIILFGALLLGSCHKRDVFGVEDPEDGKNLLTLVIGTPEEVLTRAAATSNESTITDMYVLVFGSGGKYKSGEKVNVGADLKPLGGLDYKVTVSADLTVGDKVVVLANTGVSTLPTTLNSSSTTADINTAFPSTAWNINQIGADSGKGMPMSGEMTYSTTAKCTLKRSVAKVELALDISAGADVTNLFTDANVKWGLYNCNATKGSLYSTDPNVCVSPSGIGTSDFVDGGFTNATTKGSGVKAFYVPEYDYSVKAKVDVKGNNDWAANRLCMVIQVNSRYYRLDLYDRTSKKYLDMRRATVYKVSITKVKHKGYATIAEAIAMPGDNLEYGIEVMGNAENIIVSTPTYALVLENDEVIAYINNQAQELTVGAVKGIVKLSGALPTTNSIVASGCELTSSNKVALTAQEIKVKSISGTATVTITLGELKKTIKLSTQPPIDAHFDVLPFMNVASIQIPTTQSWMTLSQNMTYVRSGQAQQSIAGNTTSKAYIHFDENIATSGAPRTAQAIVVRKNLSRARIYVEQVNLSGMVLGYFGGTTDNVSYTKRVAIESIEEYRERVYDDTSIGRVNAGMTWGFISIGTNIPDKTSGKAGTIALAKRTDSGIAGPYTIYNNYAAHYCYDKNRDTNGNGSIDDGEVVWYLPAQNQLMGAWIAQGAVTTQYCADYYWSATEGVDDAGWVVNFAYGGTYYGWNLGKYTMQVRCLREF